MSGKALFFLCAYLIQLVCYQSLIVAATDPQNQHLKHFFTPTHQDNNSTISVFRTLEKHCEYGKEVSVKKSTSEPIPYYMAAAPSRSENHTIAYARSLPLLRSDMSYRRYLSISVFRI
jgi:hypothetical protein